MQGVTKHSLRIRTFFGDAECGNLATKIAEVFREIGWTVSGPIYEVPTTQMKKIILGVPKDLENSIAALIIYNWLKVNHLGVQAELLSDGTEFIIYVGQNV